MPLSNGDIADIAQFYGLEANFNANGDIVFTDKIKVPNSSDNSVYQESPLVAWIECCQRLQLAAEEYQNKAIYGR